MPLLTTSIVRLRCAAACPRGARISGQQWPACGLSVDAQKTDPLGMRINTPDIGYSAAKAFSRAFVEHIAATLPARFVSKSGPSNRVGKVARYISIPIRIGTGIVAIPLTPRSAKCGPSGKQRLTRLSYDDIVRDLCNVMLREQTISYLYENILMTRFSVDNLYLYQRLKSMLFELSTAKLMALGLLMLFAATLPSAIASALMPGYQLGGPGFSRQSPLRTILLGCVIAPLLETLINQWACLRLLEKFSVNASVAILISSFVFAVLHDYSFAYMVTAFFGGVVLSTVFTIERRRRGHPFLATLAIHAMKNWIASAFLLLT